MVTLSAHFCYQNKPLYSALKDYYYISLNYPCFGLFKISSFTRIPDSMLRVVLQEKF